MNKDSVLYYSKPNELFLNIWLLFATLVLIALVVLLTLLADALGSAIFLRPAILVFFFGFIVIGGMAFYMFFKTCRCDRCNKPVFLCEPLLEDADNPVSQRRICGLRKAINIIKHELFSCYYCGQAYRI